MFTQLVRSALELLYPSRCACCQRFFDGPTPLCDSCQCHLAGLESEPACSRCAMPLSQWNAPCPYCMGRGFRPYQHIVRLACFDGPVKNLIHQLKYRHRWTLAEYLADRLLDQEPARALLRESDALVPIPLYFWRQFSRGYNQSDILARRLARWRDLPLLHPAARLRNTPTQTALHSRAQRIQNLRHAFGLIRPQSIRGRRIVVIDDVTTSGATLRSFGRVLLQAKPASLSAIVLAIADPRRRGFQSI